MPDGEEYDSDTEAERQAAWVEYYRLMEMSQIAAESSSVAGQVNEGEYHDQLGREPGDSLEE